MHSSILSIRSSAIAHLENVTDLSDLLEWKNELLGKTGELSSILKSLKDATPEERSTLGKDANTLRWEIEDMYEKKAAEIEEQKVQEKLHSEWEDLTTRKDIQKWSLHPLTLVINDVMDTFTRMGFEIWQAKEIVTEYENFDSVNVPASHPARDMQDTYWIEWGKHVLSTQTSSQQNNILKSRKPPFQVIVPDRVFRNEDIDATHDNTFYQVEGMVVGEKISLANLKYTIETMLKDLFGKEVSIRMRPGFFPFVEPGVEIDFSCPFCGWSGCKVCKKSGWIEFMGAGLIHPNVLKEGGVDTKKYSGFAFGFGLNRLAMIRYGIDDMRIFMHTDIRALRQFAWK